MPGSPGVYPNIYPALKALDPANSAAFIAAACMAFEWDPHGMAILCQLADISQAEMKNIVQQERAAATSGVYGAAWLPYIGAP